MYNITARDLIDEYTIMYVHSMISFKEFRNRLTNLYKEGIKLCN